MAERADIPTRGKWAAVNEETVLRCMQFLQQPVAWKLSLEQAHQFLTDKGASLAEIKAAQTQLERVGWKPGCTGMFDDDGQMSEQFTLALERFFVDYTGSTSKNMKRKVLSRLLKRCEPSWDPETCKKRAKGICKQWGKKKKKLSYTEFVGWYDNAARVDPAVVAENLQAHLLYPFVQQLAAETPPKSPASFSVTSPTKVKHPACERSEVAMKAELDRLRREDRISREAAGLPKRSPPRRPTITKDDQEEDTWRQEDLISPDRRSVVVQSGVVAEEYVERLQERDLSSPPVEPEVRRRSNCVIVDESQGNSATDSPKTVPKAVPLEYPEPGCGKALFQSPKAMAGTLSSKVRRETQHTGEDTGLVFVVGERVRFRDNLEHSWRCGVVTHTEPLKTIQDGGTLELAWNYVEKFQGTMPAVLSKLDMLNTQSQSSSSPTMPKNLTAPPQCNKSCSVKDVLKFAIQLRKWAGRGSVPHSRNPDAFDNLVAAATFYPALMRDALAAAREMSNDPHAQLDELVAIGSSVMNAQAPQVRD